MESEPGRVRRVMMNPRGAALRTVLRLAVGLAPVKRKFHDRRVVVRRVVADEEVPTLPAGYEWAWAGPREVGAMDAHPEALARGIYARRAQRGDGCLCLFIDGDLVGYQWVAWQRACFYCGFGPGSEFAFLPLRRDQAFTYDIYVYQAHRRRGAALLLHRLTFRALQERGVREAFGLLEPENHPAVQLHLGYGYAAWRRADAFRIGNWGMMLLGPADAWPLPASTPGQLRAVAR